MARKTSCHSRKLHRLAILCVLLGANAQAQVIRDPVQCVSTVTVPPSLFSDGVSELLGELPMTCTGGPATGPGSSNVNLLLNTGIGNNTATGMPVLTITFDQCSHLQQPICCPPEVPPNSNSRFFDAMGNIVFVGANQTPITVAPGDIFPFTPPSSIFGTVSGNAVTWSGVPVDVKAKGRRVLRFTNVRANVNALTSASPNANLPVFGNFSSSSSDLSLAFPSSLAPGTSDFLLGVTMPSSSSAFCRSPLVISSGVTPFAVLRQVAVGASFYDGLVTLSGPSAGSFDALSIFSYTPSTPGSCQGNSVFNTATGAVDLQNVFYQGQDYWAQANQTASGIAIVRYGGGIMPPR